MNIDFPFHFDGRGRTAATSDEDHIRDMIEQLLFTNPGERVNQPDFGCGLLQMVFAPNSTELASALRFTLQASLQRYLGDLIETRQVDVTRAGYDADGDRQLCDPPNAASANQPIREEIAVSTRLVCNLEARRKDVRTAALLGIDYIEVSDDQKTLQVFFLGKTPTQIAPANVRIAGGSRIQDVQAVSVRRLAQSDPTRDEAIEVRVNHAGDFADYTLSLVALDERGRPSDAPMPGFDVRYASATFNFKAGCPTDLDCKPAAVCPSAVRVQPEINYLAKDYASFRQLILDRLAVIMPQWQETHTADFGIMLVELLAYAGDYLSYYQDAIATEAYLATARQRISVRRHARLVDYAMHEGSNARAWITIHADADAKLDASAIYFITAIQSAPDQHVFEPADIARIKAGTYEIFEPLGITEIQIVAKHSEILLYTWGNGECCIPAGATSATLVDDGLHLSPGDVLIFEEVIGPKTGNPADADPKHRQAVRLTKVTPGIDRLYNPPGIETGQPIVEIEWCCEDALTFPLCISSKMPAPDCSVKTNLSVARGNVVLVDNGIHTTEDIGTVPTQSVTEHCGCECKPPGTVSTPGKFCPQLSGIPLTFSVPLPSCTCATPAVAQDPRQALPYISLRGAATTPQGAVTTDWSPVPDLLESGPTDPSFVVEMDNNGVAHLRFGDGSFGMMPEAGTVFTATYRVGNGSTGNVGAEAIRGLVFRNTTAGAGNLIPRNPLAASGGTDREPIEDVKMFAPNAFRNTLERAITAADYAALASDNARRLSERRELGESTSQSVAVVPRQAQEEEAGEEIPPIADICFQPFRPLQGAKGALRWNGSWYDALVAVDPLSTEDAPGELIDEIRAYLEPYRRIGHDVLVAPAQYVGLDVGLKVCVLPHFLRGHVEAALLDVFSNRLLADGTKGFFHPDNLTFGTAVYASRIVAAAQAVQGVESVRITRLDRFVAGRPAPSAKNPKDCAPMSGELSLGSFQIARLDDDPGSPGNGRLTLELGGGR